MRSEDLPAVLAAVGGRTAGSDGERRAAVLLRDRLREAGERVAVETTWVRPDWPLSLGLHLALAVAGSAVSAKAPVVGLALLAVVLVSLLGDLTGTLALLRRLTPARATQNVVASRSADRPPDGRRVRLIVTANLDAGRTGAVYRDGWVRAETALRRATGGRLPSATGLLALLVLVLAAMAGARVAGASGLALGAAQLVPTVALLVALAMLTDVALAPPSPGANANASGVAAAIALMAELRRSPPRHLDVDLALTGAGDPDALGLRALLAERRRRGWRPEHVAVLALEPCGAGTIRYLTHDGPLPSLRLHPQLIACARAAAATDPLLHAHPYRGRGGGAAYSARLRRWPAIAVCALDDHDRPGPAHQPEDVAAVVNQRTLADAVDLCLGIVERLDAALAARATRA